MSIIKRALQAACGMKMFCENVTIGDLRAKQAELSANASGLQEQADLEKRQLTAEEDAQIKAYCDEFDAVQKEIERRMRLANQAQFLTESEGRTVPASEVGASEDVKASAMLSTGIQTKVQKKPENNFKRLEDATPSNYGMRGFHNIGEFAQAVMRASIKGGGSRVDPRLYNAPTNTSSEGTSADGGYAVPPDFRAEIMSKVQAEASLLQFTDQQTSASNTLTFPTDETTPWQATGGVRVNWTGEGNKITESKISLGEQSVKLQKLAALLPVTEELLEDASAVSRYIQSRVPQVMGYVINKAILAGLGDNSGQPVGIIGHAAQINAPAETSQTADTVTFKNIVGMWSRMYARGKSRAVWVMNPSVAEQLMLMAFPGSGTAVPVYLPPNGLSQSPYATLMGRPVIETEACSALGDVGDIMLLDLSQYMTVSKTVGMRFDVSMHLYFDYDVQAFRFVMRLGGRPWWNAPIVGADTTSQYSAFVGLAERA